MIETLQIYNSISRKKEPFKPRIPGKVTMYVCGPTVYDFIHIGNARAFIFFDVVYRHLLNLGYSVKYIRNITDVDDKIIQRALREGKSAAEIAEKYTDAFHQDVKQLGLLKPDAEPKATEHIKGMLEMIRKLIKTSHAYEVEGDVYFSVSSYTDYGDLSGKELEELRAGARVELNSRKRNPLDFALWKKAKPDEPAWPSPWGEGRPGWHIECSVMSQLHLGDTIDIHGGGKDLIFPHHENERAQSESVTGKPFVLYWLHNGHLNWGKEKMSKSLGNLATANELLAEFHADVIRHAMLTSHYRSPMEFSRDLLMDSAAAMERIYLFLKGCNVKIDKPTKTSSGVYTQQYMRSMNDDFNTAKALATLFEAVKAGNRALDQSHSSTAEKIAAAVTYMGQSLGLLHTSPQSFLQTQQDRSLEVDNAWVEEMIAKRNQARKERDFVTADAIRQELLEKKILLEDHASGTSWRIKH